MSGLGLRVGGGGPTDRGTGGRERDEGAGKEDIREELRSALLTGGIVFGGGDTERERQRGRQRLRLRKERGGCVSV